MSLLHTCQDALAAVERAQALFAGQPMPTSPAEGVDRGLREAHRSAQAAGAAMHSQAGFLATRHQRFAGEQAVRLSRAAGTDAALSAKVREAADVTRAGATRLEGIAATTRALVGVARGARSPAAQRAILGAVHSQLAQARSVVASASTVAGALANDVRALRYGSDRFDPGLSPPPPLPPPDPLAPGPNDDPWVHGGDRRLSSIASAGLKQKLVAAAIVEMERNGQHSAARLLQHYLDNSGETETLSAAQVDAWLADAANGYGPLDPASAPALLVQSNLNTITANALAEARRTGNPVTVTGNTPWAVVAGSDGDAVRSLGHYSASTAYTVSMNPDGTYSMTYRTDLYDWYNFATTTPMPWAVAPSISNAAHDLHAAGYAQDFLVTGSGRTHTVQGSLR